MIRIIYIGSLLPKSRVGNFGRAAALAERWEKTMLTLKLKVGAALVLMAGILGAGSGLATYQVWKTDLPDAEQKGERNAQPDPKRKPPAAQPEEPKRAQTEVKPERTDGRGDPLPEGAILRFGSARLRHGGAIRASALS